MYTHIHTQTHTHTHTHTQHTYTHAQTHIVIMNDSPILLSYPPFQHFPPPLYR